jgi:acyl-CoA reductase-like NAD-dependent aldehyde dehydrogenase
MRAHGTSPEASMSHEFRNLIGGEWVEPLTGDYFDNRNPAHTDDLIGHFPRSGREDVDRAVQSAQRGFEIWRKTPAPARGDVLRRAGDLLAKRKEELARAATREMGKTLVETRGDVQEGIDTAYYAAAECRRPHGATVPSELRDKWAMSFRRPIGVCGVITPFNFPMAIPTWKIFPALACGNSVVFKPAEDVPHTGALFVEILLEAGLPAEVINLVHGAGEEAGAALVEHPQVPVISFTGSSATGAKIGEVCGRMHKRLSLEMGGKNAQIVMPDADLELALEGVLWGAFGTTGQRCTATSRLLLHKDIVRDFLDRLQARTEQLRIGDGLEEGTDLGPLINDKAMRKVISYVDVGRDEGVVVCGGARPQGNGFDGGFFFLPTIVHEVPSGSRMATEEIFGPVLSVIAFEDFDEAIRINNEVQYGLSSSVYTGDVNVAFRALSELDNGITYINAPTIGAEAHLPFGGTKQTGNGHREGGWQVYDFFAETKVGYVDFSGRLQRAQIDTDQP